MNEKVLFSDCGKNNLAQVLFSSLFGDYVRLNINNDDRLLASLYSVSYRNSFAFLPEVTYRKRNESKPFGSKGPNTRSLSRGNQAYFRIYSLSVVCKNLLSKRSVRLLCYTEVFLCGSGKGNPFHCMVDMQGCVFS